MSNQEMKEIMVLQEIRSAIGDNGQMMQDELVEHIKNMQAVIDKGSLMVESNYFKPSIMGFESALKAAKK